MVINFNIERLDKLLYDFYRITGLTVSVWDTNLNMLGYQPKEMCDFCRKIREYPEGNRRCFLSDKEVFNECARTGQPATRVCHAGLIDNAVPIKFQNEILGYMMFGQAVGEDKKKAYPKIKKLSKDLNIDCDLLMNYYGELDTYDEEKIKAAANILKLSARYLWLSEYIEVKHDPYASVVERYVRDHVDEEITIQKLCNETGLSKNSLYKISHESFGMPIGDYISSLKIKEAKHLLTSTNMPIGSICQRVGIKDYNYFSKFFKAHTGITPTSYRKKYPFEFYK